MSSNCVSRRFATRPLDSPCRGQQLPNFCKSSVLFEIMCLAKPQIFEQNTESCSSSILQWNFNFFVHPEHYFMIIHWLILFITVSVFSSERAREHNTRNEKKQYFYFELMLHSTVCVFALTASKTNRVAARSIDRHAVRFRQTNTVEDSLFLVLPFGDTLLALSRGKSSSSESNFLPHRYGKCKTASLLWRGCYPAISGSFIFVRLSNRLYRSQIALSFQFHRKSDW